MSQKTIEIARRSFEAFNRTFSEGTPDLYELLDPNVEWVPMSALLEGNRLSRPRRGAPTPRGHEAGLGHLRDPAGALSRPG
jgi:hypothetical protein